MLISSSSTGNISNISISVLGHLFLFYYSNFLLLFHDFFLKEENETISNQKCKTFREFFNGHRRVRARYPKTENKHSP